MPSKERPVRYALGDLLERQPKLGLSSTRKPSSYVPGVAGYHFWLQTLSQCGDASSPLRSQAQLGNEEDLRGLMAMYYDTMGE